MAAYLVTGNPGSGKSMMVAELAGRGFWAIDTDAIAGWVDESGHEAQHPEQMTAAWLASHQWVWTRGAIESAIGSADTTPLFFCGIAVNQRDMLDLFDGVFLLTLDEQTQVDRLDAPSNAHRNAAQRAEIIDGRPVFEAQMREAGAMVLDGRQPTADLADAILHAVTLDLTPARSGQENGPIE